MYDIKACYLMAKITTDISEVCLLAAILKDLHLYNRVETPCRLCFIIISFYRHLTLTTF